MIWVMLDGFFLLTPVILEAASLGLCISGNRNIGTIGHRYVPVDQHKL